MNRLVHTQERSVAGFQWDCLACLLVVEPEGPAQRLVVDGEEPTSCSQWEALAGSRRVSQVHGQVIVAYPCLSQKKMERSLSDITPTSIGEYSMHTTSSRKSLWGFEAMISQSRLAPDVPW